MRSIIEKAIDRDIKTFIFKNELMGRIKEEIEGEVNEIIIDTLCGSGTLFCGNRQAHISIHYRNKEYVFEYVIDTYGENEYLVNW